MMHDAGADVPLLAVKDLTVGFADARGIFLPANRVNFTVQRNQAAGVLGESGCGKSVTLRSLIRLVPYPGEIIGGTIAWKGSDLRRRSAREMSAIRGSEISMIFQDPASCLNPVFTVGNQIGETLRVKAGLGASAARRRAAELLEHVGIASATERLALYPHQLSGGMRQRVMIAMAIATRPDLLLADEPTTALDVTIQDQILTLLAGLKAETGMSMVIVSHDVGIIAQNCDVIIVMYAGQVMESGPAQAVVRAPRHPYTRALLEAVPKLAAAGRRRLLASIPGQPPSLAALPAGCPFQPRCPHRKDGCAEVTPRLDKALPDHGSACPMVT
jgi:oligopeptide/dipeptide ABC transporter ATP-binding protein